MIWLLFYRNCLTDSVLYEHQDERIELGLVEPESINEDRGSDLLDVCVRFPFEASSYGPIGRVAVQNAGPKLVQL